MNTHEKIQMLKNIPPLSKEEKRRKLRAALVLGLATLMSMLFFIYAFIQKMEADAQRVTAIEARIEAVKNFQEAELQRSAAVAAKMEADQQRLMAIEALENCKKSKK